MNFHKFRDFSVVFLIMISNLIPFLSENTQCTISIYYVCWALLMGNVQPNYFKYSFSHFLFLLHLLDLLLLSHRSLRLCLFFFFWDCFLCCKYQMNSVDMSSSLLSLSFVIPLYYWNDPVNFYLCYCIFYFYNFH